MCKCGWSWTWCTCKSKGGCLLTRASIARAECKNYNSFNLLQWDQNKSTMREHLVGRKQKTWIHFHATNTENDAARRASSSAWCRDTSCACNGRVYRLRCAPPFAEHIKRLTIKVMSLNRYDPIPNKQNVNKKSQACVGATTASRSCFIFSRSGKKYHNHGNGWFFN